MELLGSRSEMLTTLHWRGEMGELCKDLEMFFLARIVQQVRKRGLFLIPSEPSFPRRCHHPTASSIHKCASSSARW